MYVFTQCAKRGLFACTLHAKSGFLTKSRHTRCLLLGFGMRFGLVILETPEIDHKIMEVAWICPWHWNYISNHFNYKWKSPLLVKTSHIPVRTSHAKCWPFKYWEKGDLAIVPYFKISWVWQIASIFSTPPSAPTFFWPTNLPFFPLFSHFFPKMTTLCRNHMLSILKKFTLKSYAAILKHVLMRFTDCTKTRRLVTNSLIASLCALLFLWPLPLIFMAILS